MVMWHKIDNGSIIRSVASLPDTERLPDGPWVTGFKGADAEVITQAGWIQSEGPPERPDNGFSQYLEWKLIGNTVVGTWVQGELITHSKTVAQVAAEYAPIETIADFEAFRAALEELGDV